MTMAMQWVAQCLKGNYNGKNADMAKNSDNTSILMILKTLLQMNAAGEKILILPKHRKFPSRTPSDVSSTLIPNAELQSIKVTNNLLK